MKKMCLLQAYSDPTASDADWYLGRRLDGQQIDLYCAGKRCFNYTKCVGRKVFDKLQYEID